MADSSVGQPNQVFSANKMEEYLKAQGAKKKGLAAPAAATKSPVKVASKKTSNSKEFSESSDKYSVSDKYTDEEFESMSMSKNKINSVLPITKAQQAS